MVNNGCFGMDAAHTLRQVASRNGVFTSNDTNTAYPQQQQPKVTQQPQQPQQPWNVLDITRMDDFEYQSIFSSCPVGMAIASLGGAFIDCNSLFCKLSQYTKEEICAMTIFTLTNKCDLHNAFSRISEMIIPQMTNKNASGAAYNELSNGSNASKQNNLNEEKNITSPIILRGLMKHRDDLGLSVSLIKNSEGTAKCFCVTLMKNVANDSSSKNLPAMIMDCQQQNIKDMEKVKMPYFTEHAYTTG